MVKADPGVLRSSLGVSQHYRFYVPSPEHDLNPYKAPSVLHHPLSLPVGGTGRNSVRVERPALAVAMGASLGTLLGWSLLTFIDSGSFQWHRVGWIAAMLVLTTFLLLRRCR
ncbi:MAG: hypothetical protein ABGX07_08005 [Pirellulaceae bacterium]|nr:hypothetical protein [Planctomycetaceae bacterium]